MTSPIIPARRGQREDADGGLRDVYVAVPQAPHPEDAAFARRLGLDPARIVYDPWGEAWYGGTPLSAMKEG